MTHPNDPDHASDDIVEAEIVDDAEYADRLIDDFDPMSYLAPLPNEPSASHDRLVATAMRPPHDRRLSVLATQFGLTEDAVRKLKRRWNWHPRLTSYDLAVRSLNLRAALHYGARTVQKLAQADAAAAGALAAKAEGLIEQDITWSEYARVSSALRRNWFIDAAAEMGPDTIDVNPADEQATVAAVGSALAAKLDAYTFEKIVDARRELEAVTVSGNGTEPDE